jgi:hypothetical protein
VKGSQTSLHSYFSLALGYQACRSLLDQSLTHSCLGASPVPLHEALTSRLTPIFIFTAHKLFLPQTLRCRGRGLWHPTLGMSLKGTSPAANTEMIKPSKPANTQDDCPLFKLAAETRNQIYQLLFTKESIKTNKDGSIDLNGDTVAPSNALLRTCQQIYNESHKVYGLAYSDYPTHTFVIDMPDRNQPVPAPAVSETFFRRIKSFRVNWRADEHNKGQPLRFTSHFDKIDAEPYPWRVRVELHDEYWRGEGASDRIRIIYADTGGGVMNGCYVRWSASLVARFVQRPRDDEAWVWEADEDENW